VVGVDAGAADLDGAVEEVVAERRQVELARGVPTDAARAG
jgi:hypothetical protein